MTCAGVSDSLQKVDLLDALLLYYSIVITALLSVGLTLLFTGRYGKFSRALLVSAMVGIIVPVAVCFSYPYFFPPPVEAPPHPIDQNAPFLPQFFASLKQDLLPAIGQQVGYAVIRIIDPFCYGVLAMVIIFLLSFLIPCRLRQKIGRDPSIGSG